MLVNVPNVTRLQQFKMAIEGYFRIWDKIVKHIIGIEQIAHKCVPDVVVLFELLDQVWRLFRYHHTLDLGDTLGAKSAEYKHVLVSMLERVFPLPLFIPTVVVYPRKVFSQFGDQR